MSAMLALVERNALVARRIWLVILSGFVEPVFYLLAVGLGLGSLIGSVTLPGGRVVDYITFVAPALLAVSAMNGALYDSTINFFWKLKYQKFYETLLVTPLNTAHIVFGEITWAQLRGVAYSAAFLGFAAAIGATTSVWALLALPCIVLIGFAFAAAGLAVSSFMRSWRDLEVVTVTQLAMFLLGTTFFPLTAYPPHVRPLVEITPLYQANELLRGCFFGDVSTGLLPHVGYLVVMTAAGLTVGVRRIGHLLHR